MKKETLCLMALVLAVGFGHPGPLCAGDDPVPIVNSLREKVRILQNHFGSNASGEIGSKLQAIATQLANVERLAQSVRDAQSELESLRSRLVSANSELESAMRTFEAAKSQFEAKKAQIESAAQSHDQRATQHNNAPHVFREEGPLAAYNAEAAQLEEEARGIQQRAADLRAGEGQMMIDAHEAAGKKAEAAKELDEKLSTKQSEYEGVAGQFNTAASEASASISEIASQSRSSAAVASNSTSAPRETASNQQASSRSTGPGRLTPFEAGPSGAERTGDAPRDRGPATTVPNALTQLHSVEQSSSGAASGAGVQKGRAGKGLDDLPESVPPVAWPGMPGKSAPAQVPPQVAKDPGYRKLQQEQQQLVQKVKETGDRISYVSKHPNEAKAGELAQLVQDYSKAEGESAMKQYEMNTYHLAPPPPPGPKTTHTEPPAPGSKP